MSRQIHTFILRSAKTIAPKVRHLVFACDGMETFSFVPGQFITLHVPYGEKILNRSYSIANIEQSSNLVEFAASYVENGAASQLLFNMQPGDKINATGPFGRLILRDEQPARYILMATGTGITPYRAMLSVIEKRLAAQENLTIMVLFGTRTQEDLLYSEEFLAFAAKHPRFEYHVYYSRYNPAMPKSFEHNGYVHSALTSLNLNPQNDIVYLCGNPNMIDETYAMLSEQGFSSQSVRREKYISTG